MAELNMPHKGGRRTGDTRIDLTPMVDLGFILITFFMYTTSLAHPFVLDIRVPSREPVKSPTAYPEESTITLIPATAHTVIYYQGTLSDASQLRKVSIGEIRGVLAAKKREAASLPLTYSRDAHLLHVVMKPDDSCKYEDVVRLFDELQILNIENYALTDLTGYEKEHMTRAATARQADQ